MPPPPRELDGNNRFGGWVPDIADPRDNALIPPVGPIPSGIARVQSPEDDEAQRRRLVSFGEDVGDQLPDEWRVEGWDVGVLDQGRMQSCVSCAITSVVNYLESRRPGQDIDPSRLFIYYNAREIEGTENDANAGTGIRTAIKAVRRDGVSDEELWPYETNLVASRQDRAYAKPPAKPQYQDIEYFRVYRLPDEKDQLRLNLDPIRRALRNNLPVICGFTAFKSFVTEGKSGVVPLPTADDAEHKFRRPTLDGDGDPDGLASFGHAAVIIGYNNNGGKDGQTPTFRLVNSWGGNWGTYPKDKIEGPRGEFDIPAEYLASPTLATDFWVINALEPPPEAAG